MWLFLSNAFLSIAADPGDPDLLLVRARAAGDIERVFPGVEVTQTPERDYHYRALIGRDAVAKALYEAARRVHYSHFKASVAEHDRHLAYFDVWRRMLEFQRRRLVRRPPHHSHSTRSALVATGKNVRPSQVRPDTPREHEPAVRSWRWRCGTCGAIGMGDPVSDVCSSCQGEEGLHGHSPGAGSEAAAVFGQGDLRTHYPAVI